MKPIPKTFQMIHDFEKEAEEFLNTYGCGDAISTPQAVKVDQIIQRMSLKVVDTYVLSTDNSIQGAITFAQGQLTVYDQKRQELTVPYQKGTIFLDASIQNIKRKRNTMIHECFHWHKHRYFFENTADPASSLCHRCEYDKAQYSSKKGTRTTIDRIEWQARTIAPKILMPKPAAMKLMQKLLAEKKITRCTFGQLLDKFASTFIVSNQSACLRLMEFDCPMAAEYYENTYTLSDKIGKIIKREDILRLYLSDADFRDIIKTEQYCYTTEGVIVLNHPKYVSKTDGVLHVTDYALQHKEECIISLQTQSVSRTEDSKNLLFRRADRPSVLFTKSDFLANSEDNGSEKKELIYNKDPIQNFTTSGAMLYHYIKMKKWTPKTFDDMTNLGPGRFYTFQKQYDNEQYACSYTFETLISTGFALELSVFQMEKILNMSNYTIIPDSIQNWAYRFCFELCQDLPIGDCNNMLRNVGLKGLNNRKDQT